MPGMNPPLRTLNAARVVFLAASFLLLASFARAEVRAVGDGGFILENTVAVEQDVATTWTAFVEEIDNWWPKDHSWWLDQGTFSIDSHAGGCFCERNGESSAEHMRIVFVDPGKLLRMSGGLGPLQGMGLNGALDFSFSEADGGTEVVMTYSVSGFSPDGFEQLAPVVDTVQALQIGGLKDFLSNRQ